MRTHALGQYSRDLLSVAAPPEWKTRETEWPPSARLGLELDAEVDDVDDTRRRLLGQSADRARPTQATPREQGVLGVQRGESPGRAAAATPP